MGINLSNVTTLTIGFERTGATGGTGVVLFDGIRLYRVAPPVVEPVDPGTNNLMAYYAFENNTQDGSGNGYNATASGNPQYVSGPTGYGTAIELDGTGDYVELPIGPLISTLTDCTISIWVNWSGKGGPWKRIFDLGMDTSNYIYLCPQDGFGEDMRLAITAGEGLWSEIIASTGALATGRHYVAIVVDGSTKNVKLTLNNEAVGEMSSLYVLSDLGNTTQIWLGRSQYPDPLFNGSLDEFRIYDRVLSASELLYHAGYRTEPASVEVETLQL